MNNSIQLDSGLYFNFIDIHSNTILITDVAHGLAHQCRYCGQCDDFYSIAEHSVNVFKVATRNKKGALLHDSPESMIHDITKPLKVLLPDYGVVEKAVEAKFEKDLGYSICSEVHRADVVMLKTEQSQLFANRTEDWGRLANIEVADIKIECLPPKLAKQLFLDTYYALIRSEK